ncbi:D-tyrosyl-tRNA(Tyr) deacylase [Candidatus Sumerlaeota bacterium]|nr:D-tyrosyl-tRNA(Tyr) deacylase [Candidatus Sumerlaeota bacterium]
MRVVLQRVSQASVKVNGKTVGEIGKGLLVLAGIGKDDTEEDLNYIANKIVNLRIFEDEAQKFNRSLLEIKGDLLVVSQFTLYADCRKGRRPGFTDAAPPEQASAMFDQFVNILRGFSLRVETGVFQAMMDVNLCNYGPVTIIMDSKEMSRR